MGLCKTYGKFLYYKYIKKDTTAYARSLGVKIGKGGQILANPISCFGTEPWLITLGDHVDVTSGVRFFTHDGGIWVVRGVEERFNQYDSFAPIKVGNNVMVGSGVQVMPGVSIGDNVIIAAGAVVSRDIPSDSIYGGVPARKISDLDGYMEKMRQTAVPTKAMSLAEKRKWLLVHKPEWFQ